MFGLSHMELPSAEMEERRCRLVLEEITKVNNLSC